MTKHPGVDEYETKAGTRYRAWYLLDGKRKSRSFTTLAGARRFRRVYEQHGAERALAMDSANVSSDVTLEQALERWLSTRTRPSEATIHTYRLMAHRSWLPALNDVHVQALTQDDVAGWVKARRRVAHESTVSQELGRLQSVLTDCVNRGLIATSPAAGVQVKKDAATSKRPKVITEDEFYRLLDEIPPKHKALVQTLGETGMRWGEATALPWRNVNLDAGTLTVDQAWKKGHKGSPSNTLGVPKTPKSFRTVSLRDDTVTALREQYRTARDTDPDAFVFPGVVHPDGTRAGINHAWFMKSAWRPARKRAGLPVWVTPHVLRHAHASWLLGQGTPVRVVTLRLGHETTHVTETVYGHWIPDAARLEAEWVGKLAGRSQPPAALGQ